MDLPKADLNLTLADLPKTVRLLTRDPEEPERHYLLVGTRAGKMLLVRDERPPRPGERVDILVDGR